MSLTEMSVEQARAEGAALSGRPINGADHGPRQTHRRPAPSFRLLTAEDLRALPATRWRVKGLLPETGLAVIFGTPGSGKTFLTLDLARSIASGQEWFGRRTRCCPVTLLALEGKGGLQRRVLAIERHQGSSLPVSFVLDAFDLRSAENVQALAAAVLRGTGPGGVVVIDTLNRAAPGVDENSSRDMGELIDGARVLQESLGGLVILVHHAGKQAASGMRGHSSLLAAIDTAIEVTDADGARSWTVSKSKDGEGGIAGHFRLDSIEIGEDEDGDPITSCVVEPSEASEGGPKRRRLPTTGNQKIVWDRIGTLLRERPIAPPEGIENLPAGRPAIAIEEAVDLIAPSLPVEPKRQRERVRDALSRLISHGVLDSHAGFVWVR